MHVAECLVRPKFAAVFRVDFFACPEAVLVELEAFGFCAAENHRAQSAIADWQGFGHPGGCRAVVPEREVSLVVFIV